MKCLSSSGLPIVRHVKVTHYSSSLDSWQILQEQDFTKSWNTIILVHTLSELIPHVCCRFFNHCHSAQWLSVWQRSSVWGDQWSKHKSLSCCIFLTEKLNWKRGNCIQEGKILVSNNAKLCYCIQEMQETSKSRFMERLLSHLAKVCPYSPFTIVVQNNFSPFS